MNQSTEGCAPGAPQPGADPSHDEIPGSRPLPIQHFTTAPQGPEANDRGLLASLHHDPHTGNVQPHTHEGQAYALEAAGLAAPPPQVPMDTSVLQFSCKEAGGYPGHVGDHSPNPPPMHTAHMHPPSPHDPPKDTLAGPPASAPHDGSLGHPSHPQQQVLQDAPAPQIPPSGTPAVHHPQADHELPLPGQPHHQQLDAPPGQHAADLPEPALLAPQQPPPLLQVPMSIADGAAMAGFPPWTSSQPMLNDVMARLAPHQLLRDPAYMPAPDLPAPFLAAGVSSGLPDFSHAAAYMPRPGLAGPLLPVVSKGDPNFGIGKLAVGVGVPQLANGQAGLESSVPPPSETNGIMPAADMSFPPPAGPEVPGAAPAGEQGTRPGDIVVLAAKVLTESDMKHSRAILPRVAVENNLPFLLGYRTYGLYIPDPQGRQWEFVIKSWANGRADRGVTERRQDRRVYVVEGMSAYLNEHKLGVGDVIGIVVVDGHLEVHCQSAELTAWIARPTYGAQHLVTPPTPIWRKCTMLEDIPDDGSVHRQCMRSARCNKPDGHPGFCVGRHDGMKVKSTTARLKLTIWPPPPMEALSSSAADPSEFRELVPSELPAHGVLVSFRLQPHEVNSSYITMTPGTTIKVPESCARERALRLTVSGPPGQKYEIYFKVIDESSTGHGMGDGGSHFQWLIGGLEAVLKANECGGADEICIEREDNGLAFFRLPASQLPPLPLHPLPSVPAPMASFGDLLCQRTQGCMKALNHTGFCSGHKGFKRKSMTGFALEDTPAPAPKRARKSEGKKRAPRARVTNIAAAGVEAWPAPAVQMADMHWYAKPEHMPGLPSPMDVGQRLVKPADETAAADVLVALAGANGSMPPEQQQQHGDKAALPLPPGAGSSPRGVPAIPPAIVPDVHVKGMEHHQMLMGQDPTHGAVPSADHEEDHDYLGLLQSAMTNLQRSGGSHLAGGTHM